MQPPNSPPPYTGPTFLTASKYASPQLIKTRPVTGPPALATTKPATDATIATKEQIAAVNSMVASNVSVQGVNAQLAIELSSTLKKEVDNYAAKYSSTVSSAVANARQLLGLIRKSMSAADLKAVDQMWTELEQLFVAVNDAKTALPVFLEKQKNNMSLYHASLLNEAIRENQEELNLQHKKVNLQHNLILEQQHGFQEYKTQAEARLQDVQQLHDRVSRLTLEKGNLRTEIDRYQLLLEQEISDKSNELKKAESLQKEYTLLSVSKAALQAENDALRTTKDETRKKLSTAEQSITERFTAEIELKAEELSKSNAKIATLDTMINTLKAREVMAKKEADKVKVEYNSTKEKYNQQSTEYADTSMVRLSDSNIEGRLLTMHTEAERKDQRSC
jgi:chromosome segregation ATPase